MRSREKLYKSIIKDYEDQNLMVGKTLHEYIAQDLYAIRLTLYRYSIEHGHSLPVDQVLDIINGTLDKVQQMANALLPAVLRDFGFQRAIKDLFLNYSGFKNDVFVEHVIDDLDFSDQLRIFQLVQYMLKATFIPDDSSILVCKLFIYQSNLLLEIEGISEYYIKAFNNYNKENIKKLQERINILEGTLDINTNIKKSKIVVVVKLD
jgi:glucose-6-phosphate-specific signal transduction histidine kinase